jgi:hypothetical protein
VAHILDATQESVTSALKRARAAGVATIHVVGTTAAGAELVATVTGVPFVSSQHAGSAGVAWHELDVTLPSGAVSFGPEVMASGHISVSG